MNNIIVTVICDDQRVDLNLGNKFHKLVSSLTKSISRKFNVEVDYYYVFTNEMGRLVDFDDKTTIADFNLKNGDILYVNYPHAKARPCDMIGDTFVVFEFDGCRSHRVNVKKENSIMSLYQLVNKEKIFQDNFFLRYEGEILNIYSRLTIFETGIKKGAIIEICGQPTFNYCDDGTV